MAKYSRIEVVNTMKETGIVPVFYHPDLEICKQIVATCYEAGVRVFEFTNRADFAHEVFNELNKYVLKNFDGLILGVGSVIESGTAAIYLQLGANFVVSPIVNQDMARICNRRKVAWIPGCGSVSEISNAEALGAEVVKIFPGMQVGGPDFIKSVKGPMPWTSIMPTGGIYPTKECLSEWFEAGAHCVGLGSSLFKKNEQGHYDIEQIRTMAVRAFDVIKKRSGNA